MSFAHSGRSFRATTTDVSASGGFIATKFVPPRGTKVTVEVRRNTSDPVVQVIGVVKRTADAFGSAQPGFGVTWLSAHAGRNCEGLKWFVGTLLQRQELEIIRQAGGAAHAVSLDGAEPEQLAPPHSPGYGGGSVRSKAGAMPSDAIVPAPLMRRDHQSPRSSAPPPPNPELPPRRHGKRPASAPMTRTLPPPSPDRSAPPPSVPPNLHELRAEMELQDAFAPAAPPPELKAPPEQPASAAPPAASMRVAERESGVSIKRALLSVTGRLFGRHAPPVTGAIATSSDGWFYQPDGDGPISAPANDSGSPPQQFRTGRARTQPLSGVTDETTDHSERPGGQHTDKATTSAPCPLPRRNSPTVPRGEPGDLKPLETPCSYVLFKNFIGANLIAASKRAVTIEVDDQQLPRENQTLEINVPVYDDGRFRTISLHGPVISEPERSGEKWTFTVWIADVTEFGLASAWLVFLYGEFKLFEFKPPLESTPMPAVLDFAQNDQPQRHAPS